MKHKLIRGPYTTNEFDGFIYAPAKGNRETFPICEVRGWGYLQYRNNPEETQDANKEFIKDAMNAYEKDQNTIKKLTEALENIKEIVEPNVGVMDTAEGGVEPDPPMVIWNLTRQALKKAGVE